MRSEVLSRAEVGSDLDRQTAQAFAQAGCKSFGGDGNDCIIV
jgi:hypothetical protein